MKRPVGVTILAILYIVGGVALLLGGLFSSQFNPYIAIPMAAVLAALSAGIWQLQRWARVAALILAARFHSPLRVRDNGVRFAAAPCL
jgi:hypothetical protein